MPAATPVPGRPGPLAAALACWAALSLPGALGAAEPDAEAPGAVEVSGSGPLEARIVVETQVEDPRPDGSLEKRFVETLRLEAGQEVYYTIRVTNPGKAPVQNVVVTKRMPFGVDYVSGSAAGPACVIEFSSDNAASFAAGDKKGDYTHVRWTFRRPLAPGATALLRFRATFR